MRDLVIASPHYWEIPPLYPTRPPYYLVESCKALGLTLEMWGRGELWPQYIRGKVLGGIAAIEKIEARHILFTDSQDAFFCAPEVEILEKYRRFKADLVVAGEANCYPNESFRDRYPTGGTYRFLNSGGLIGTKEAILDCLAKIRDYDGPDDDQFRLSSLFIEGYPLKIDTQAQIFQCMSVQPPLEIALCRPFNRDTSNWPCQLHFNGRTGGIDEWFTKCFGELHADV